MLNEEQKTRIDFADKLGQTKDKYKEKQHGRAKELLVVRTKLTTQLLGVKDKYARVRHSEKLEYLREKNSY